MSEPSAPAPTPQAQQETRCYHDAGHRVIHGVRVGFYEGGDVAPMFGGRCDLIAAPHVARAATARAAGGTDGEALPEDDRDPECVARWPECASFGYDPRCCRFPKACSCEMDDLPARAAGAGAASPTHVALTVAEHEALLSAAGAGAPDDEALIARHRAKPHRRLDGTWEERCAWCGPVWPCDAAVLADRLAALNATVTRRDTSIAAFKADLAAVRAELAQVREAFQNGQHYEIDGPGVQPCICGNEWICPRWAEPTPEDYADAMDQVAARDAVVAAVRALHVESSHGGYCVICGEDDGYGGREGEWPCPTASALGSSTGTGSSDE